MHLYPQLRGLLSRRHRQTSRLGQVEEMLGEPIVVAIGDRQLGDDVERIVAATGRTLIRVASVDQIGRPAWSRAAAIVLDGADSGLAGISHLPRRSKVVLVGLTPPTGDVWRWAVSIGAEQVLTIPDDEARLVTTLSSAGRIPVGNRAGVVAVMGGRGGAGASVFAAALGLTAPRDVLVIDADPCSAGLDLVLGWESLDGLRWPDLALGSGRIGFDALRQALPNREALILLSGSRTGGTGTAEAMAAVLDSAGEAGVLVIADLPRRLSSSTVAVLERADLVVVVTPAQLRACSATALMVSTLRTCNPNIGLVVRGPSPSGLRAADVAAVAGVPLLAAIRPEPDLDARLDSGGLRLSRRSPLAAAARNVLALVATQERRAAA